MVNDEGQNPSETSDERTAVDLGEDLLEETVSTSVAIAAVQAARSSRSRSQGADDQLESARILLNEGLVEDAKKVLRQILLSDSKYLPARRLLEEIHEIELKQIFSPEQPRRRSTRAGNDETSLDVDSEEIMHRLDEDLRLGLFSESGEVEAIQLSIFRDSESLDEFAKRLDTRLLDSLPQDRIDLGIAFLEMGLFDLAARQFRSALKREYSISSTSLLAYALIQGGRPFEATLVLEPVVRDSEISREDRLELFYLMGRACESLKKWDSAKQWFEHVREIDPHYRDVEERLIQRE